MNRRFFLVPAVAFAVLLPLGSLVLTRKPQEASANSAPAYWAGSTAAGAFVTGEQCPIEVEKETLTLNIPRLPETGYSSQEEFETYDASVTAEYTFYNPTEMDVEMNLLFPFGSRPRYADAGYDEEKGPLYFDDTARYDITSDGERVERTLRYTYQGRDFRVEDIDLLLEEKVEDKFYTPALSVAKYQYTVDFPQGKSEGLAQFVLRYNPTRTHILCTHYRYDELINGELNLYFYADKKNNSTFGFTAVWEAPEITPIAVKDDGSSWDSKKWKEIKGAEIRLLSEKETTFGEYVEEARPAQIGEVDFYNGTVDKLVNFSYIRNGLINFDPAWLKTEYFMRWYSYSLKIPAGERVVNRVTAPLYPDIGYKTCRYEYLLSPAQKWADFGTLEIFINTEFDIEDPSLDFKKTEGGYALSREGLPLSELTFSIEGDYVHEGFNAWTLFGIVALIFIIIVLSVPVAAIVVGIVFAVKFTRKDKKK